MAAPGYAVRSDRRIRRSEPGSLFFGVSPGNPTSYLEVALLMIAIALVACLLPALRAVRLNPMVALRYE
jgi:putative ABC transport system permease protein